MILVYIVVSSVVFGGIFGGYSICRMRNRDLISVPDSVPSLITPEEADRRRLLDFEF